MWAQKLENGLVRDKHCRLVEYEPLGRAVPDRASARPARKAAKRRIHEIYPSAMASGVASRTPTAALKPLTVLRMQKEAGNTAVTAFLQRRRAEEEIPEESSPVLSVIGKGGGEPIEPRVRREMETRLGEDFSDVRIHAGAEAARSAASVAARAYTVGNEVVLGAGTPALDSREGKRTLAHELTHVVQQRQGPVEGTPTGTGIAISDPSDRFELAAEAAAERAMTDPTVEEELTQRAVVEETEE
jgi:hypothetical protein